VKKRNPHTDNTHVRVSRQEAGEAIRVRVSKLFADSGLTQTAFGDLLGASQGTVQRWLSEGDDGSVPEAGYLVAMIWTFGVSGHWLLTGVDPEIAADERTELHNARLNGWLAAMAQVRRAVTEAATALPEPGPAISGEQARARLAKLKGVAGKVGKVRRSGQG